MSGWAIAGYVVGVLSLGFVTWVVGFLMGAITEQSRMKSARELECARCNSQVQSDKQLKGHEK